MPSGHAVHASPPGSSLNRPAGHNAQWPPEGTGGLSWPSIHAGRGSLTRRDPAGHGTQAAPLVAPSDGVSWPDGQRWQPSRPLSLLNVPRGQSWHAPGPVPLVREYLPAGQPTQASHAYGSALLVRFRNLPKGQRPQTSPDVAPTACWAPSSTVTHE